MFFFLLLKLSISPNPHIIGVEDSWSTNTAQTVTSINAISK